MAKFSTYFGSSKVKATLLPTMYPEHMSPTAVDAKLNRIPSNPVMAAEIR